MLVIARMMGSPMRARTVMPSSAGSSSGSSCDACVVAVVDAGGGGVGGVGGDGGDGDGGDGDGDGGDGDGAAQIPHITGHVCFAFWPKKLLFVQSLNGMVVVAHSGGSFSPLHG